LSTLISFTPSITQAFQFQPTIAGTQYNAVITWSLFGQRYYLNLSTLDGTLLCCTALVATGPTLSATLNWADTGVGGIATVTTASAHNVPLGQVVNMTVSETGTAFDGEWQGLSTGTMTLTYALSNPNVSLQQTGKVDFPVNAIAPFGIDGAFLFRFDTQQFEYA
jgi:hypothetical protein